jgi:hypothetical protein
VAYWKSAPINRLAAKPARVPLHGEELNFLRPANSIAIETFSVPDHIEQGTENISLHMFI